MKIGYRLTRTYKDRPSTIFAYFRHNSKVIQKSTGLSVMADNWSSSKQRGKGNDATIKLLNKDLNELSNALLNSYNKSYATGEEINGNWLQERINAHFFIIEDTDFAYLTNVIDDYVANAPYKRSSRGTMGLSQGVIDKWKQFGRLIETYEKELGHRIKFKMINGRFINAFRHYLMTVKGYNQNYTNKLVSRVKTMCSEAEAMGVEVDSSYKSIKAMQNTQKNPINILTFEELDHIKTVEMPSEKLLNVKNWILLGAYCGQRSSDLLKITSENIEFKGDVAYISLVQEKGNVPVVIGIDDAYIVDMLRTYIPYKISRQKLADYMEEVLEICGLDEKVDAYLNNPKTGRKEIVNTFKFLAIKPHDLRRSFCTNYFHKGVAVSTICSISGHKRESTFYSYCGLPPNRKELADAFLNATK